MIMKETNHINSESILRQQYGSKSYQNLIRNKNLGILEKLNLEPPYRLVFKFETSSLEIGNKKINDFVFGELLSTRILKGKV